MERTSKKSRKLSNREHSLLAIDRLSSLPDEVICQILSFLPTKLSVSTCVLAKRWRSLWAHVPVLDFQANFYINERTNGISFVDKPTNTDMIYKVILWHKAKTLRTLRLRSMQRNEHQLETLISVAIDRKIQNLYLEFAFPNTLKLCRPLFNCKTVVDMRLGNCKGFPSTGGICLPSLKKLHLSKVEYKDDEALSHLLSGSPLLQELILDCGVSCSENTLNISSSTIKMLELNLRLNHVCVPVFRILIDAPEVRCLRVGNCDLGCITIPIDMSSLLEVDMCFRKCYAWEIGNNKVIDRIVGSIGKFNNLTKLELQLGVKLHLLVEFLKVADNLEVLIADIEIHNSCMETKQVPKCLQSSLKTVTIKQQGFEEHELDPVHYLLRNSQVLERMEILPRKVRSTSTSSGFLRSDLTPAFKALKKISMFERGSKACQLVFFSDC
ncbi:Putative FBD-associated F-box protein [Striga hermonthica]|uniref:FBD-associated F-box protein n=1 Tax=Striga hermonthica TaxID=68872 RepID=A0A9N7MUC3_STRHE|nr:Putative FBD-associated F-box protein [Striga hermonthica]